MTKVIIVDKAAIARAPMAMQMFKKHAPNLEVIARSLTQNDGDSLQDDAAYVLRELNYEYPHDYVSIQLREDDLDSLTGLDFVFSFSESHLTRIADKKAGTYRLQLLSEYAGHGKREVQDPERLVVPPPTIFKYQDYRPKAPFWASSLYYRMLGKLDERDVDGRRAMYLEIGREIQLYVQGAIARMQREGIVIS